MPLSLGRRLGVLTLSIAATAAMAGPAQAALLPPEPGAFPEYFEDDSGLRIAQCIAEAGDPDPVCPAEGSGDHLWYSADSVIPTTDGNDVTLSIEIEGHAADATAPDIVEAAIGVGGQGLAPNATYTVFHPYGQGTITTDDTGRVQGLNGVLHSAACGEDPCDAAAVASETQIGPFLRQAGVAFDNELFGDGATAGPVVGSPIGRNSWRIVGPGIDAGSSEFTVLAGAPDTEASRGLPSSAPSALAFGGRDVGTASGAQSVTVANDGFAPLAVAAPAVTGANAGDFAISNGCAAPVAAVGGRCSISVTFTPSAAGARSATLTIPTDGADGDASTSTGRAYTVALSGTGVAPQQPAQTQQAQQQQAPSTALQPLLTAAPRPAARIALNRVGVPSRLRLRTVRARGIALRLGSATASRVLVRIMRGKRSVYRRTVATGNRIRLRDRAARRLRAGRYTVQLTPIAASGQRGATITRRLTISR